MHGGVVILIFGVALAIFWSGFLRVGAQSALLLAPLSAVALLIAWTAGRAGPLRRLTLVNGAMAPKRRQKLALRLRWT